MKKNSSSAGFISQVTEQYGQFLKKFSSTSGSYKDLEAILKWAWGRRRLQRKCSLVLPDRTRRHGLMSSLNRIS